MIDDPTSHRAPFDLTDGIVVGLGARVQATAAEILALIDKALSERGLTREDVRACTTSTEKQNQTSLIEVSARLGVPLLGRDLAATAALAPTPSEAVRRHIGHPSVAEAAALAFGPLLMTKRASANATCALAGFYPARASTLSAASTLSTSGAGS